MVSGCSDAGRKLIPFVTAPEDIIPGEATWYATTCRECPAGCGMLAKNRDGRVIKVEGNPLHPINTGKLCARGQASVQGIYNPDRLRAPATKLADGTFRPVTWKEAEKTIVDALTPVVLRGDRQKVVFLSDLTSGSEMQVVRRFLASMGSSNHIMYEPLAYEALRQANRDVFGVRAIPAYQIDAADFLISFGANFLETWVSNVRFSRQFARFREPAKDGKNPFIYVGPRLSMTAANADHWIATPPGGESLVALGLLHLILEKDHGTALARDDKARVRAATAAFTPDLVAERTGVKKEELHMLARSFMKAARPLALAEGLGLEDPAALDTGRAANLLSSLMPGSSETMDFSRPSLLSGSAPATDMKTLTDAMLAGKIKALFILRANPAFHLPQTWHFSEALKTVPLVVYLGSYPDETGRLAHVRLPIHTFLESWGDYTPEPGIDSFLQPVMGPIFDTRNPGDILLSLGQAIKGRVSFPEKDFYEVVRHAFEASRTPGAARGNQEEYWLNALKQGGSWNSREKRTRHSLTGHPVNSMSFAPPSSGLPAGEGLSLISYPTIQFFDGRMANRPILQELPDPMTAVTWGGWVEINPETARRLSIKKGDVLLIRSESGTIEVPAYPYPGIEPGTLAIPYGLGHSAFGRYAPDGMENSVGILGKELGPAGSIVRALVTVTVTKKGTSLPLAHTDGSADQHDRHIARSISLEDYLRTRADPPDVVLPLSRGFVQERDFYSAHTHDAYRWCMAVDLDRCIGCGACVAACYTENNVAVVGRKAVLKGRTMAWLHIERYFEPKEPFIRFIPMLCQHCDEAPCESVCPVFAPNHSKEGINNQVYNRCIGTRYCSQNCPYKVRRFNWLTWTHDAPLEWQFNPDVTRRTKGVMEKCSFCIQRIVEAKIKATGEKRLVRDGEFAPACAQTCPADALVFGNLKDPESRVARLVGEARAYQVLGELNTKPGVIYLKKITRNPA